MDCREITTKLNHMVAGISLIDNALLGGKEVRGEDLLELQEIFSEAINKFLAMYLSAAAIYMRLQDHSNWEKFMEIFGNPINEDRLADKKLLDGSVKEIFVPFPIIKTNQEKRTVMSMFSDLSDPITFHLGFVNVTNEDETIYLDVIEKIRDSIKRVLLKRIGL